MTWNGMDITRLHSLIEKIEESFMQEVGILESIFKECIGIRQNRRPVMHWHQLWQPAENDRLKIDDTTLLLVDIFHSLIQPIDKESKTLVYCSSII